MVIIDDRAPIIAPTNADIKGIKTLASMETPDKHNAYNNGKSRATSEAFSQGA